MEKLKKSTKWNEKLTLNSINWTVVSNVFIVLVIIACIFGLVYAILDAL